MSAPGWQRTPEREVVKINAVYVTAGIVVVALAFAAVAITIMGVTGILAEAGWAPRGFGWWQSVQLTGALVVLRTVARLSLDTD